MAGAAIAKQLEDGLYKTLPAAVSLRSGREIVLKVESDQEGILGYT